MLASWYRCASVRRETPNDRLIGKPSTKPGSDEAFSQETTIIKFSVYYPTEGGSKFDHDYYRTSHMPLIQERLGDACLRYEIEKGLAGREPGSAPEFVAACHIYSPSLGTFREAFGPHRAEIVADVANYTDIAPIVQISEIVGA